VKIGALLLLFTFADVAKSAPPIDLVFDLDWTLVYSIPKEQYTNTDKLMFQFRDEYYRFSDHAVEVIRALHQDGSFRISYCSGGDKARNEFVIDQLYQRIAISGGDRYEPHRVLNFEDLVPTGAKNPGSSFVDRYRKDITKIGSDVDLRWAILIDDQAGFTIDSQKRNQFWLGPTYRFFNSTEAIEIARRRGIPFLPPDEASWRLERRKLLTVFGAVMQAKSVSLRQGTSFVSSLERVVGQELSATPNPQQSKVLARFGQDFLNELDRLALERWSTRFATNACSVLQSIFVRGQFSGALVTP
jgi:hypothetical protein